jgi:acyl-CoA thioester hydrolase
MARLTYRGAVYPWQCDQMGHMNVMWYVGKMDEASHSLFASIGMTRAVMRESGCVLGALQQNISYTREVLAGDVVEVHSRVIEMREKVIRFEHELRHAVTGEVCATCEQTVACIDASARRARPFPEAVRAAAEQAMREG